MSSTISASDLKTATDSVNADTLLASVMGIVTDASNGGFYNVTLPYIVSDKQKLALQNLGYAVTLDDTSRFTVIDWSSPQIPS